MKWIIPILISVTLLFNHEQSFAQREKGEQILTVGIGLSIWNLYAGVANLGDSINASSTPTFYGTYDYGITKQFSLGGSLSYNSFAFSNPYYSYINSGGNIVRETISVVYRRVNLALRPLYHWGKNEDFEWFAGMRLGYSFWTAELETTDPFYSDDYYRENAFSAQLLFGSRAYIQEYLSITFDVGIGAPYFASVGLSLNL